jgi:hypothetical protein
VHQAEVDLGTQNDLRSDIEAIPEEEKGEQRCSGKKVPAL